MIRNRRPCKVYDNGLNVRVSAICGFCHTHNYIVISNEKQFQDLCDHNIEQNIKMKYMEFCNDPRARRSRD